MGAYKGSASRNFNWLYLIMIPELTQKEIESAEVVGMSDGGNLLIQAGNETFSMNIRLILKLFFACKKFKHTIFGE